MEHSNLLHDLSSHPSPLPSTQLSDNTPTLRPSHGNDKVSKLPTVPKRSETSVPSIIPSIAQHYFPSDMPTEIVTTATNVPSIKQHTLSNHPSDLSVRISLPPSTKPLDLSFNPSLIPSTISETPTFVSQPQLYPSIIPAIPTTNIPNLKSYTPSKYPSFLPSKVLSPPNSIPSTGPSEKTIFPSITPMMSPVPTSNSFHEESFIPVHITSTMFPTSFPSKIMAYPKSFPSVEPSDQLSNLSATPSNILVKYPTQRPSNKTGSSLPPTISIESKISEIPSNFISTFQPSKHHLLNASNVSLKPSLMKKRNVKSDRPSFSKNSTSEFRQVSFIYVSQSLQHI